MPTIPSFKKTFRLHGIPFEWSPAKAVANQRKHEIGFETACQVFFDPFFMVDDATRDADEVRHVIFGMTTAWQLLAVVFVEDADVIRLISARPATAAERRRYEAR